MELLQAITSCSFSTAALDSIINDQVTAIASGLPGCPYTQPNGTVVNCGAPFSVLDSIIAYTLSAKMFITLLAMLTTLPYGPLIGLMMLMGLGSFLKADDECAMGLSHVAGAENAAVRHGTDFHRLPPVPAHAAFVRRLAQSVDQCLLAAPSCCSPFLPSLPC